MVMQDEYQQDGGGLALGMYPYGDPRNDAYDLPAYDPSQAEDWNQPPAPAAQGMSEGVTGVERLPRYSSEDISANRMPPMNQAFNVDQAGEGAVRNLIGDQPARYGGGFMKAGGQTTAIMNPLDASTAGGGQVGAPAQVPYAAQDAPVIERARQQARIQQQTIAMNLARRTSEKEQLAQAEEKMRGQQKILPSGLERWDLEHFVADQDISRATVPTGNRRVDAANQQKLEDAKATLAHLGQVDFGLDDIGRRKSQIDEELKAISSGPMPPSPDEAGRMVATSLQQRRAAAAAKASKADQEKAATKELNNIRTTRGRLKASLADADKTIKSLSDPGSKESMAIIAQVKASGVKPDGTPEGNQKFKDAVNAAKKPALDKATEVKTRLGTQQQQVESEFQKRTDPKGWVMDRLREKHPDMSEEDLQAAVEGN